MEIQTSLYIKSNNLGDFKGHHPDKSIDLNKDDLLSVLGAIASSIELKYDFVLLEEAPIKENDALEIVAYLKQIDPSGEIKVHVNNLSSGNNRYIYSPPGSTDSKYFDTDSDDEALVSDYSMIEDLSSLGVDCKEWNEYFLKCFVQPE